MQLSVVLVEQAAEPVPPVHTPVGAGNSVVGAELRVRQGSHLAIAFDAVRAAEAIAVRRAPVRAPTGERRRRAVVGTVRREVVDRMRSVGRRQLVSVLARVRQAR